MRVTPEAMAAINAHAAEGYPHEVCGFLVGPRGGGRVTEAVRARNVIVDRARDRYEIDPIDLIRIQRRVDDDGLDLVGYYHSHPDHPARASVFDAERSWAGPIYVIVSCEKGTVVDANAFVATQDGGPFRDETLEVG